MNTPRPELPAPEWGRSIQRVTHEGKELAWCCRCKTWKPVMAFGKNASRATGLAAYCRQCHNYQANVNRGKRNARKA